MVILNLNPRKKKSSKSVPKVSQIHPDYPKNAEWFEYYFVHKEHANGIRYHIRSSDHGNKNLASISYRSPNGPDYCNMIALHQNHDDFKKEIELMYKKYLKTIQNDCNPNR